MQNTKRKIVAAILFLAIFCSFLPHPTRAGAWGEDMLAVEWKLTMEQILKKIEDSMVAMLKTQGIQMVMGQLKGIMGGGKGGGGKGTGPIGNWKQFIYDTATKESKKVTSDFFKSQKQGTPAALAKRVISPAEKAVMSDPFSVKPDLQKYVREGRADMIFQQGWAKNPWQAWRQAAMPQNDQGYMYMRGLALQQESFRQKEEEKKAEGIAGAGFQSKKAGGKAGSGKEGNITTPGSSQKDLVTKITSMPMDRLSMANTLPDIVAAMVTQVLTQMLKQGLAMANQQIGGAMKGAGGMGGIGNIQNMIMKGVK